MTGSTPRRPAPRDDLVALEGYHSPQVDVAVRLNTNESPYPAPQSFVDAWRDAVATVQTHRYPDRSARDLRVALGSFLGQPADRVFCANGSNEVIQTLLLTYGGASRSVLVFEPTYALHSHISHITGTKLVRGERRDDFTIDPDAMVALLSETQPDIVFLCSPNNPTGLVEPREIVELALQHAPGLVVVDEAYAEFAPWSPIDMIDESRPLVVVRTYSKVWSMAALRLGFCVGPSWVVDELSKVVLPYHLSVATQLAGTMALDHRAEMDARVEAIVHERERVAAELAGIDGVEVFPSGANFLLFRPSDGRGERVWEALLEHSVLVRNFARWPGLAGCLRVTIGRPDENDAFLLALKEVVS
jgi:histidinol-phosphate aminotransferase